MQKTKTLKGIGKAVEAIAILSAAGLIVYDFLVLNTLGIADAYYAILGVIALLMGFVIEMTSDVLLDIESKLNNQQINTKKEAIEKVAPIKEEVRSIKQKQEPKKEVEKLRPTTPINIPKREVPVEPIQQIKDTPKSSSAPIKKAPVAQTRPEQVRTTQHSKPSQIKPVSVPVKPVSKEDAGEIKSFFSRDERYKDIDAETDRAARQFVKQQRELSFNQTRLHDEQFPIYEDELDEVTFNSIANSVYEEPKRQVTQRPAHQPVDAFGGIEAEEDMTARLRRLSKNKQSSYKTIDLN